MKTLFPILVSLASTVLSGQAQVGQEATTAPVVTAPQTTAYSPVARGQDYLTWERYTLSTNRSGSIITHTNRYVELQTGKHYSQNGSWLESREEIQIVQNGAVATTGPHKVTFTPNINSPVSVQVLTPDNKLLKIRPLALAYYDFHARTNVLIAELKDSQGVVVGTNQVIYSDAFTGLLCDIRYTYKKAGFEQDVILRQRPPLPEAYGLNPATTWLQVLTEFIDPPEDVQVTRHIRRGWEKSTVDNVVDFGQMKIGNGRVFSLDQKQDSGVPVQKHWTVLEGRTILIEEVSFPRLVPYLRNLQASRQPDGSGILFASHKASASLLLPPVPSASSSPQGRIEVAAGSVNPNGVVLDFDLETASDVTLQGDTTYVVTGPVWLSGNTIIEGGTVVKCAGLTKDGGCSIHLLGPVQCLTGPYRPAVFTAYDDDTIGEVASGSTGTPSGFYAYPALDLQVGGDLKYLSIRYASEGIRCVNNDFSLSHSQIVLSDAGVHCDSGNFTNYNVLMSQVNVPYLGSFFAGWVEHVTCDQAIVLTGNTEVPDDDYWCEIGSTTNHGQLTLTNCITCAITNGYGPMLITTDHVQDFPSGLGVFKTIGAGGYYLIDGSTNRNAGTTNIDPGLLAALRQKTTYSPLMYSNLPVVTTNVSLSPVVQRDTNVSQIDLGYHYDPIDYFTYVYAFTNATLTITNGAVIGYGDNTGIWLRDGAQIICEGTPTARNRIVSYRTVQEQPVRVGSSSSLAVNPYRYSGVGSPGRYRFTDFSRLAGPGNNLYANNSNFKYSNLEIRDCAFMGGECDLECGSDCAVGLTNNLFEAHTLYASGDFPLVAYNNLFRRGNAELECGSATPWPVRDNAFDSGYMEDLYGGVAIAHDHNAFINEAVDLMATDPTDMVLTNFAYASGLLGAYYQAGSALTNQGSRTAPAAGLFHYTTTTNQAQEGLSQVDIGLHYIALGTDGKPIDSDTNGVPDYLDDADGNGLPDIWELQYFGHIGVNPYDDPDGDGLSNYQEYLANSNPQDMWIVAWGNNLEHQCNAPSGLNDVAMLDGGLYHTVALRSNGVVVAWGSNSYGQTNVPGDLTNGVSISSSALDNVAVRSDGTVAQWGSYWDGLDAYGVGVPAGLSNVTSAAAGMTHALALEANGTLVGWGLGLPALQVPTNLASVKAVAAGWAHSAALLSNGTVVVWGYSLLNITNMPAGLTNITAIAAGGYHTLVLHSNGTVSAWGAGETNVVYFEDKGQSIVPAGLSNVVALSAGGYNSMALLSDGTVVTWGELASATPYGLAGVTAIGAGDGHCLAARSGRQTPLLSARPASQCANPGQTVTFSGAGFGLASVRYQWQSNGVDIAAATNTTLTLVNVQTNSEADYRLKVSNGAGDTYSPPATLTLVKPPVIVSRTLPAEQSLTYGSTLELDVDAMTPGICPASVTYLWYSNSVLVMQGRTNYTITSAKAAYEGVYSVLATNVGGSATNVSWTIHVAGEGSPIWWGGGAPSWDYLVGIHDVAALAAGSAHFLAARDNGTVLAWGDNTGGQTNVPANLSNVVAVAAGDLHSLALKADGTVVGWGDNTSGQTNAPASVTNATAISAGGRQSLALRKDGTVAQWGLTNAPIPAGLANVTAIASGTNFNLALSNATVVAWGANDYGQTTLPANLTNVVAIAAGGWHALAVKVDGTVVAWGDNTYGQTNVPAGLSNVMAVAGGYAHSMALRNDGTVVAWGGNSAGQTNVPSWLGPVKLIAAGGNQSLVSMFSPLVQYPVDVTKDLLLIYNTNSLDSSNVCAYYLQHRPMVSGVNVLGVGCWTNEVIDTATFTNQILAPLQGWLAANPTKHPQYMVLFPAIPSRVWSSTNCGYCPVESLAYGLNTSLPGIPPFVTSINMGFWDLTNDCIAYINKLEQFGTNSSPGKLVISASAGPYGNTNFVLDGIRHGTGYGGTNSDNDYSGSGDLVWAVTNSLLAAGVPQSAISFYDGIETISNGVPHNLSHPTGLTNLAGYICWGAHSSLGNEYPRNGTVVWGGNSSWWIIDTLESFNGWRSYGQGNFTEWFSDIAFGGTNHENTPVGAVSHTDEPGLGSVNDPLPYFGLWASGKSFAICAWNCRRTPYFQAVGDPFVQK